MVEFNQFDDKYLPWNKQIIKQSSVYNNTLALEIGSPSSFAALVYSGGTKNATRVNNLISNEEPKNFIYPYFSKRKAVNFTQTIKASHATVVEENLQNLYSKIDRIASPDYPAYQEYVKSCKDILGFTISCALSTNGKEGGLIVNTNEHISIDEMGEGTTNILGLIVDLCVAEDKLFLIEELENDIHPKALKGLLNLIIKKSESNQFIVSTHSNIVTKYLGAPESSRIFSLEMELKNRIPKTSIKRVNDTPEARIKVLEDLGYELYDFELWQAYLILEESSAERIIRDYLIPTFVPNLKNKLKTIAAQGVNDLSPRFHDFLRLFVFIHTSSAYENRAWIIADGDKPGISAIKELRNKFKSWDESHFSTFTKPNFEDYYPKSWQAKAKKALKTTQKKAKFKAKGQLVKDLIDWTTNNKVEARKEFAISAKEIIQILKKLDTKIK